MAYIDVDKKIEEMNMRIESITRLTENRPYDEEAKLMLREHKFCLRELKNTPTADVVEVCRCSECKHLKIINKEPVYAECERQKLTFLLWQADTREHTCSYGERK